MRARSSSARLGALLALLAAGCTDRAAPLARGDVLWADSSYTQALAEYRLALRSDPGDPELLLRTAHAFARLGDRRAAESYAELVRQEPSLADQALFDLARAARAAGARGNVQELRLMLEAALDIRPELRLEGAEERLAPVASRAGDRDAALAWLERGMASAPPDSLPDLIFRAARLREDLGSCTAARRYYARYLELRSSGAVAAEARQRAARCGQRLAQELEAAGLWPEALDILAAVAADPPEALAAQVWLQQGDMLARGGLHFQAAEAYGRIFDLPPEAVAPRLVQTAAARIRDLGLIPPRPDSARTEGAEPVYQRTDE